MWNRRKNCAGFTLMECLIVLLMMSFVLLMIVRLPFQSWQQSVSERLFIEKVTAQLNLAQQEAIIMQRTRTVRFEATQNQVTFNEVQFPFPRGWKLYTSYEFNYFANGRTDQFSTVSFYSDAGKRVQLVFQLGSGKFEVRQ
ncbi:MULTISPECIES: competence type IV pilus minor pilin ComGD [unclassified Facklamia]|uniref:competence type IV pilus minor pilin ComGD n=1 Tax=Aerococcaceae TaxID=186827 RepID=UPI0013B702B0|nr:MULTISPECIES: competence type IV pilus minor pilin ComGD [unclassified Facklamia]NEW63851.1 prepilin-type N-terminal cleavage/methylation domain-containing protein [Facklamia sp. 252]NEW67322.1 prepilin-type N-terminal cleavage/methylation domain-containing protein [Facklamia sp. 253]